MMKRVKKRKIIINTFLIKLNKSPTILPINMHHQLVDACCIHQGPELLLFNHNKKAILSSNCPSCRTIRVFPSSSEFVSEEEVTLLTRIFSASATHMLFLKWASRYLKKKKRFIPLFNLFNLNI